MNERCRLGATRGLREKGGALDRRVRAAWLAVQTETHSLTRTDRRDGLVAKCNCVHGVDGDR
jgi:hypothetical protein